MIGDFIDRLPPWLQLMVGPQTLLFPFAGAALIVFLLIVFGPQLEVWLTARRRKKKVNDLYPKK
jgi:hypothetical protein